MTGHRSTGCLKYILFPFLLPFYVVFGVLRVIYGLLSGNWGHRNKGEVTHEFFFWW